MRKTVRALVFWGCMVLLCMGCGRKLPPMPPGMPDPVEIVSAGFDEDRVIVKARCSITGGEVSLLGKAKGICPACTDDLKEKDVLSSVEPGEVVLMDISPDSPYMVYRVAYKKDTTVWMTPVTIVVK
ncbi:MAG: hypothetical protein JXM72_02170 [Deltaproteobacteria bacterium]|nr:hypothetical protein [Deltaproteobacteria bacterium]